MDELKAKAIPVKLERKFNLKQSLFNYLGKSSKLILLTMIAPARIIVIGIKKDK